MGPVAGRTTSGRTALVTGGSRGIGLAIPRSLVGRGARVVLTARKADALTQAVEHFGCLDMLVGDVGANPVHGPGVDLVPTPSANSWNWRPRCGWTRSHRPW